MKRLPYPEPIKEVDEEEKRVSFSASEFYQTKRFPIKTNAKQLFISKKFANRMEELNKSKPSPKIDLGELRGRMMQKSFKYTPRILRKFASPNKN